MKQEQQFWLLELLANWEGKVDNKALQQQFRLNASESQAVFDTYIEMAPNNLLYQGSLQLYAPTDVFKPLFINEDASEYLAWRHNSNAFPDTLLSSFLRSNIPSDIIKLPARKVTPTIMQGLVKAIQNQKNLNVDYVSLKTPECEGRVIAPHSFVNSGARWHLRAWCEKNQRFSDFVLSRFRGEPTVLNATQKTAENDLAWNTPVTAVLKPDPRLNPKQQEVLENDYQMTNGELRITTRACYVSYLLMEMQVKTRVLEVSPEAQQLILTNHEELKEWLF